MKYEAKIEQYISVGIFILKTYPGKLTLELIVKS